MQISKVIWWYNVNYNVENKEKSINRESRLLLSDERDSSSGHVMIMNLYVPNNIASK